MKINISLLPAKGHYFLFFASLAGIYPLGAIIASQLGASPALVGTIYLTLQITTLVAKPAFGVLADKLQQKKLIFLTCLLFTTAVLFAISLIPPAKHVARTSSLLCQNQSTSLAVCDMQQSDGTNESQINYCNAMCRVSVPNPILDHLCVHYPSHCQSQNTATTQTIAFRAIPFVKEGCGMNVFKRFEIFNETIAMSVCFNVTLHPCNISCDSENASEDTKSSAYEMNPQIMYFWMLMIASYIFMASATSLGDTIVLSIIPNYEVFGRQRMYGSIGFGLSSIIVGQLVATFSDDSGGKLNFTPAFYVILIFGVLDFVVASRFTVKKVEKPRKLIKGVGSLFLRAETMLFTTAVFLIGFLSGLLWTFQIVYLVSLRASPLLIGLTIATQCFLGEVPFMFVSEWFLKKIGHGHSMTLVLATFGIRYLLYHLIENPWFVLPIETTHGFCFGVFFTALATYSSVIAPPSLQATMQGTLQAVFDGLGAGAGSFFGGLIYQALGGKTMWLVMGAASCSLAIIHGAILAVIQRRKSHKNSSPPRVLDGDEEVKDTEMLQMLPAQSVNGKDDGNVSQKTAKQLMNNAIAFTNT